MANKDTTIIYQEQVEICKRHFTAEQFGRLMYALFEVEEGNEPDVDEDISVAFEFMALQKKLDRAKYDKIVERNRKNGRLGGAPKGNQNARKNNPKQPNGFQNNPNDNVNENDNDNENVNVNEASHDDTYGTLGNVILAPGEYEHLKATYERYTELIDKVSVWLPNSNGRHYDDHFALCLKFANNDNWPKKRKIESGGLPEVVDPLPDEEHDAKVAELKATLNGMFTSS